jgi:hypothetical protein
VLRLPLLLFALSRSLSTVRQTCNFQTTSIIYHASQNGTELACGLPQHANIHGSARDVPARCRRAATGQAVRVARELRMRATDRIALVLRPPPAPDGRNCLVRCWHPAPGIEVRRFYLPLTRPPSPASPRHSEIHAAL